MKVITSLASPSSPTTTFVILSHSLTLIFLSCNRLLAVENVIKLINPWHFNISKFVKFWKDIEDGTKIFNLPHCETFKFSRLHKIRLGWVSSFHKHVSNGWFNSSNSLSSGSILSCFSPSKSSSYGNISYWELPVKTSFSMLCNLLRKPDQLEIAR